MDRMVLALLELVCLTTNHTNLHENGGLLGQDLVAYVQISLEPAGSNRFD